MTTVTKESLSARIAELESGPRSIKEDFYLAVMKELQPSIDLKHKQDNCMHDWLSDYGSEGRHQTCQKCRKGRSF